MSEEHKNKSKPSMFCPGCGKTYTADIKACPRDGVSLVPIKKSESALIGKVIDGRFDIHREIGAGGMGAVYEATQLSVERKVAFKTTHMGWNEDATLVERFMREAKLSSQLNHPNIVSIIDFGRTDEGLLYLVMELIPGQSLGQILRDRAPLSVQESIHIGIGIVDGLVAAHALNIVHRDLKPGNIMVNNLDKSEPKIKILDFGIAKLLHDEEQALTQAGQVVGTPRYLAPEVLRGEQQDARGDLFSLGVILYQMLSGAYPFAGSAKPNALLQLTQAPAPLPQNVPDVLANLTMNLLEHDVERRTSSAELCRESLKAIQERLRFGGGIDVAQNSRPPVNVVKTPEKHQREKPTQKPVTWYSALFFGFLFGTFILLGYWLYGNNFVPSAENVTHQTTSTPEVDLPKEKPALRLKGPKKREQKTVKPKVAVQPTIAPSPVPQSAVVKSVQSKERVEEIPDTAMPEETQKESFIVP